MAIVRVNIKMKEQKRLQSVLSLHMRPHTAAGQRRTMAAVVMLQESCIPDVWMRVHRARCMFVG